MLLDQQYPMEPAFAGPAKIADRMGGLDLHRIAEADPETFVELRVTPPAVHRYPGSMAGRIQAVAQLSSSSTTATSRGCRTEGGPDGAEVLKRLKALPGFGEQKAKIFLALLGKQFGVRRGLARGGGRYGEQAPAAPSPTSPTRRR